MRTCNVKSDPNLWPCKQASSLHRVQTSYVNQLCHHYPACTCRAASNDPHMICCFSAAGGGGGGGYKLNGHT